MLESSVVYAIRKELGRRGAWVMKLHGSQYQAAGAPDLIGCLDSRFFGIEVKRPGEELTPLQQHTLDEITTAGGIAGVARSVDEALALLGL